MEAKGRINQYNAYESGLERKFTINLATGTTPFIKHFDGVEYASQCYRLTQVPVVTHAWYRPTREEFDKLSKWEQDHVLNGGLCFGELTKVQTLQDDPTEVTTDYETFQEFCLKYYGRRLLPMPQAYMSDKRS